MSRMELTNFTVWGRDWFEDGWDGLERFCAGHGLVGVELLSSGADPQAAPPDRLVQGIHLSSLGSWLPLVGVDIPDRCTGASRYAGATTYAELVSLRAQELREMAVFSPRYAVWHATYILPVGAQEGAVLAAEEFLARLATLVHDVVNEFTPPFALCFENAYGLSLDPDAPAAARAFLDSLDGLEAGLALDIGHHLNRRRELATPRAACEEFHRLARGLRAAGVRTPVLHLHWTPPELAHDAPCGADEDPGDYFARSDLHLPLCCPLLRGAVDELGPEVVVHEAGAMTLEDHDSWLAAQTAALRG